MSKHTEDYIGWIEKRYLRRLCMCVWHEYAHTHIVKLVFLCFSSVQRIPSHSAGNKGLIYLLYTKDMASCVSCLWRQSAFQWCERALSSLSEHHDKNGFLEKFFCATNVRVLATPYKLQWRILERLNSLFSMLDSFNKCPSKSFTLQFTTMHILSVRR